MWDAFFGGRYGAADGFRQNNRFIYFDVRDVTAGNVKTSENIVVSYFDV